MSPIGSCAPDPIPTSSRRRAGIRPRARAGRLAGRTPSGLSAAGPGPVHLVPDQHVVRLFEQQRADHERQRRDDDRVVEAGVDVAGVGDDRTGRSAAAARRRRRCRCGTAATAPCSGSSPGTPRPGRPRSGRRPSSRNHLDEDQQDQLPRHAGSTASVADARRTAALPPPAAASRRRSSAASALIAPVTGLRCEIAVTTSDPAAACIAW